MSYINYCMFLMKRKKGKENERKRMNPRPGNIF